MTVATMFTLVRIAFVPLFMFLMHKSGGEGNVWIYSALGVFILASITDFVDGYIARKYSQVTDLGKFLDPLADKLLVIACMVMFCQWDMMPGWALMLVLTREFAVTGLRLVASSKGIVIAAGLSGKIKTVATMVGLSIWMAFPEVQILGDGVMLVILITTIVSGIEYFWKNWNCFTS